MLRDYYYFFIHLYKSYLSHTIIWTCCEKKPTSYLLLYWDHTDTCIEIQYSVHNSWQKLWLFRWQRGGEKYISLFLFLSGEKTLNQNVSPFMASVHREKMNLPPKCAFPLQWSLLWIFLMDYKQENSVPLIFYSCCNSS